MPNPSNLSQLVQKIKAARDFIAKSFENTSPYVTRMDARDKAITEFGYNNIVKPFGATAGLTIADQLTDNFMPEGPTKDFLRTALQTGALVTGIRGTRSLPRDRGIRALKKEKDLLSKNNSLTPAEEQRIDNLIAAKNDSFKNHMSKVYLYTALAAGIPGAADAFLSGVNNDIKKDEYRPRKTLYSNSAEEDLTLNNQGATLRANGIPFNADAEATVNWENFVNQGERYNENKSMRSLANKQNTLFRFGGYMPDGVFPWYGTKVAGKYNTEDTNFMRAARAFSNITKASDNKSIVLEDDDKFNFSELKNAEKQRFSAYIKALGHSNNKNKIKNIIKSLKDSGIEGINYDALAKAHGITL